MAKCHEAGFAIWDDVASKDAAAAEAVQIMRDYFKEMGKTGF
jgi:hypothetical protein